jgi:hypothetical protein
MKTALLPATRVEPTLRKDLEAALEAGETLSTFIEAAVRAQLQLRQSQRAFLARGLVAERSADASGDWLGADEVLGEVAAVTSTLQAKRRRRVK